MASRVSDQNGTDKEVNDSRSTQSPLSSSPIDSALHPQRLVEKSPNLDTSQKNDSQIPEKSDKMADINQGFENLKISPSLS